MNQNLVNNNYIVIPNFISSYRADKLKKEYREYAQENNLEGDSQSPNSSSFYNYISFLELLCEKTPEVSEILEETVIPTYAYSRVYKNGSTLEKHTDRDACEISLTLNLGGDHSWPIWIKNPNGENLCVELNPGDAMMYLGRIAEHWREQYYGNEYFQVFLHYVKSRGECSYTYFDKESVNKPKDSNNLNKINDNNSTINTPKTLSISSQNKLEDFIKVFDDVLDLQVCDLILEEYQNSNEWGNSSIGTHHQVNQDIRNCMQIQLSNNEIINKNYDVRSNLDANIFKSVNQAMKKYSELFPTFHVDVDTGYQLLCYKENQFYTQHTDSFKEEQRSLSCSIQLNEDYDGGEFAFFDREMMIRSKKGSAIVFPSNFMYPHEIMPVIRGTRYSIVTWLI
jgi:predicted 2-oxoglutarate/Fe(II)-dependent dioxygenase YbiX